MSNASETGFQLEPGIPIQPNEWLPPGKSFLDPFNARRQVGELHLDICDAVISFGRFGAGPDKRTLTVADHDQALGLQLLKGTAHGASGHAVAGRNVVYARKSVARSVLVLGDCPAEQSGELKVRRPVVVRIEFVHVTDGKTWVNTPRSDMRVLTLLYLSSSVTVVAAVADLALTATPRPVQAHQPGHTSKPWSNDAG